MIIKRLAGYCQVVSHHRGRFNFLPQCYNGLCHYRVRILHPIPSFFRFGQCQIMVKYPGQRATRRRCNCVGHMAANCPNKKCFNCEGVGHEAYECITPKLCCLCKDDCHTGSSCPYSWMTPVTRCARTDESDFIDADGVVDHNSADNVSDNASDEGSYRTLPDDNFAWANEVLDDDYDGDAAQENQPLVTAFVVDTSSIPSPMDLQSDQISPTPEVVSCAPDLAGNNASNPAGSASVPAGSPAPLLPCGVN